MRIVIAQINPTIGDFPGNQKKILDFAWKAKNEDQADLILFPELSLCGYPPGDLLEQDQFTGENIKALRSLMEFLPEDLATGLGYVKRSPRSGDKLLNAYGVIYGHEIIYEQFKITIPNHDYFDQGKYFESGSIDPEGSGLNIFEFQGKRIGIAINEDAWTDNYTGQKNRPAVNNPVKDLAGKNISILCVPAAVPFVTDTYQNRLQIASQISSEFKITVIHINMTGANDSLVFDGRSFATDPSGKCIVNAKAFEEDLVFADLPDQGKRSAAQTDSFDELEQALVLGIRDYMKKCGFKKTHLGLSGGIDSALVAYLAVRAAGPENVVCFNMPSRFSSKGSKDDSRELAGNLGCRYEVLPIESIYSACLSVLDDVFEKRPFDTAEENLQARIRGLLWMGYANKFNSMLLTAGNKSELAMGYCTLYGDTNGALAPIGDLFKTQVISLCKRINERSEKAAGKKIIPQAIIEKAPSAELRPNQTDQDSLPPYEVLDEILKLIIYENKSPPEIIKMGRDAELVRRIYRTMVRSEWKRRQTPQVLKVSVRPFGAGRNMPLARAIYEI